MRKIIQITFEPNESHGEVIGTLHALCDDGTIWFCHHTGGQTFEWVRWRIPPIPQNKIWGDAET